MRVSSYDRTQNRFIVLLARREAEEDPEDINISIPSTIQLGKRYHRYGLFVGEGFAEGEKVWARWTTEDIEPKTGYRENSLSAESILTVVKDGKLNARIPQSRRLTTLVFEPYRDQTFLIFDKQLIKFGNFAVKVPK